MTLYAWARSRRFPALPPAEARLFAVSSDTRVLGHCHWQRDYRNALTVIVLHGLEGSSGSHYVLGLAEKAWRRGFNVVRLNQRNCGGTEHLTPGLYHSGLTADPIAVMRLLADEGVERFAFCGYSLGGNLALKLAGEIANQDAARVVAVTAVSPPLDLAACVEALERPGNLVYHWNYLRGLRRRMRRKGALFPNRYDLRPLADITSVRAFDETFTAPHNGFASAADYYHRASARRVIERLAVPALLVTAEDDPFVPPEPARDPALADVGRLTRVITRHGGHCGYVGRRGAEGEDAYWAERRSIDFVAEHAASRRQAATSGSARG